MSKECFIDSESRRHAPRAVARLAVLVLLGLTTAIRADPIPVTTGPILDIHVEAGSQNETISGFDTVNNRSLVVWTNRTGGDSQTICGQLVNADGSLYASPISFSQPGSWATNTSSSIIAFSPADQRFLVTWCNYQRVYAQLVNSDGSLYGGIFRLSPAAQTALGPVVEIDTIHNRFLAAWNGPHNNVYTQFIKPDGSLDGPPIAITDYPTNHYGAFTGLAFDAHSEQFLVTWAEDGHAAGQLLNADGTLHGTKMDIGYYGGDSYEASTSVSTIDGTFLHMWGGRGLGRLINPDGTFVGDQFEVFEYPNPDRVDLPSATFDSVAGKFLIAGAAYGTDHLGIVGQYLDPDGSLYGDRFQIFQVDEVTDREDHWHVGSYPPWAMFCTPDIGTLVTWTDIPYNSISSHDIFARYVKLEPVPIPGAMVLGILGMGVAGWFCRRRTSPGPVGQRS